jgi:hypothetical protein
MSRALKMAGVLVVGLASASTAFAYVRAVETGTTTCLFWNTRKFTWSMFQDPSNPGVAAGNSWSGTQAALQAAASAWQSAAGTDIQFDFQGPTSNFKTGFNSDGCGNMNLVIFRDHLCSETGQVPANAACLNDNPPDCGETYNCWDHSAGSVDGVLALTTNIYDPPSGQIAASDMEFNSAIDPSSAAGLPFNHYTIIDPGPGVATCATDNNPSQTNCIARDVQNIATHEWGHFIGLGHSLTQSATMYAYSENGDVAKRVLSSDDVAGIDAIYPAGQPTAYCKAPIQGDVPTSCTPPSKGIGCSALGGTDVLALGVAIGMVRRRRRSR